MDGANVEGIGGVARFENSEFGMRDDEIGSRRHGGKEIVDGRKKMRSSERRIVRELVLKNQKNRKVVKTKLDISTKDDEMMRYLIYETIV